MSIRGTEWFTSTCTHMYLTFGFFVNRGLTCTQVIQTYRCYFCSSQVFTLVDYCSTRPYVETCRLSKSLLSMPTSHMFTRHAERADHISASPPHLTSEKALPYSKVCWCVFHPHLLGMTAHTYQIGVGEYLFASQYVPVNNVASMLCWAASRKETGRGC